MKDSHCISVLRKSRGDGMNGTALASSEKDQWLRQAAGFHVFDAGLLEYRSHHCSSVSTN